MLQKSSLGAVLAEGPGLVMFDALYEPGATIDSPPDTNLDTYVPEKEKPALDQVIEELQLRQQSRRQVLHTLSAFFQDTNRFSYSSWQELGRFRGTNETPLSRFLLRTPRGHCEYFATATVCSCAGSASPPAMPSAMRCTKPRATNTSSASAMPTPGAWCGTRSANLAGLRHHPSLVGGSRGQTRVAHAVLSDFWSRIMFEFAKLRWGQTHLRQYLLWGLAPVLALLLYQIIFRSRRQGRPRNPDEAGAAAWPGLDSEFYQVERKLVERGARANRASRFPRGCCGPAPTPPWLK